VMIVKALHKIVKNIKVVFFKFYYFFLQGTMLKCAGFSWRQNAIQFVNKHTRCQYQKHFKSSFCTKNLVPKSANLKCMYKKNCKGNFCTKNRA
jgi:hypothetical protein